VKQWFADHDLLQEVVESNNRKGKEKGGKKGKKGRKKKSE
jgi:hypothetical protein